MKRLRFASPDSSYARQVVDDLRGNGIPDRHINVVGKKAPSWKTRQTPERKATISCLVHWSRRFPWPVMLTGKL